MRNKSFSIWAFWAVLGAGLWAIPALAGDIAVYGDSQHDERIQRQIVKDIASLKPAAVFRVGDMVDDGNDPKQWRLCQQILKNLPQKTRVYPTLGNHEKNSPLYYSFFKQIQKKRWYSVDEEDVHCIVLDSNADLRRGSKQYLWLEWDLAHVNPKVKFILVFFHHPLFSVGGHDEDEKNNRSNLAPLFEKYGVGAVFSGHDHNYQRFSLRTISYVISGGGGSTLRDGTRISPYLKKYKKTYHFCVLSESGGVLKAKVLDPNMNVVDEFDVLPVFKKTKNPASAANA